MDGLTLKSNCSIVFHQQGYRVIYREAHTLLEELADATLAGTRKEDLAELETVPLLIVDDLGMPKLPHTAAEDLLELIVRRYERASTSPRTDPSTTGASCWATPRRSRPCSIGCSIMRTSSNAALAAGARSCRPIFVRRKGRSRSHQSRPPAAQWSVLRRPPMAGFTCPPRVSRQDERVKRMASVHRRRADSSRAAHE